MALAELGWKALSDGADPGGTVLAVNSGTTSLRTSTPGLCFGNVSLWM